jgi:hypothetical protein
MWAMEQFSEFCSTIQRQQGLSNASIINSRVTNGWFKVSNVTCYFRHLQGIFEKAGIEVAEENKHEVDKVIHGIVGVPYKNCPETWREVKKRLADDQEAFATELKEKWMRK